MMQYPILAVLPPPVVVSYWLPIQIWCNILSWLPCLLPSSFLIEFLFKYNAISSHGCLASSCGRFLLNSYSNMMQYPLLAALPPPVAVSHWIPIQIWCNILSWLPCLLPSSFLIEFLFKYNAISSHGCLASSRGCFLLNSYSNMMQSPLLAALPPPVVVSYWFPFQIWCNILSWLPCMNWNSIRIKDWRMRGSQERILHYIWIGLQ